MRRNWTAIRQVRNYHLQMLLWLCNDRQTLARLAEGFPEYFLDGEDEGPVQVSYSDLLDRAEARGIADCPNGPPMEWKWYRHLTPILGWEGTPPPYAFEWVEGDQIPLEIRRQVIGRWLMAPMFVFYDGRKFFVAYLEFKKVPQKIGTKIHPRHGLYGMGLIEAGLIKFPR